MPRYFTAVVLLVWCALAEGWSQSGSRITVSGTVRDAETGETLIGATIFAREMALGTTSNEYGFYALNLPAGTDSLTLEFSYVGYHNERRRILPQTDLVLNVELGMGLSLREVVVRSSSREAQLRSTEMSVENISTREVKVLPALLGESDILKTIRLKPGIPSGSEGSTGIYVRGGGADQNLIVLDEAVVYNANHLFGFFSTFNTDAVKDLKLYKGGFPAQYGGRLSSVIDIRMKEGNNKRFSGTGGVGLIASRLTLEGPVGGEHTSFIVSARRTYADLITRRINEANEGREDFTPIPDYYFYDLNTKINHTFGARDRLYLSGYFGRDVFSFDGAFFDFQFDWGNATGTLRWNHVFSPRLFSNVTFTLSDYQYNISNKVTGFSFNIGSEIRDIGLKLDLYHTPNSKHTMRYGAALSFHRFDVGRLKAGSDDGKVSFSSGQRFYGTELGAYVADEWTVGPALSLQGGLRFSAFFNDRTTYAGLEPRLSAKYSLTDHFSIKASYARMRQYLHLVSSSSIALPTDVWYPSTRNVEPQIADQLAAGFHALLGDGWMLVNEYYYKWLYNQVDFIDGAHLFANDRLEEEFAFGDGYAWGAELSIEKREGRLTGWMGYTLAFVRKGNFRGVKRDIMDGRYFAPRYDRRHDLSVVAMYELSQRLTLTATAVYGSGDLTWLPTGRFAFQDVPGQGFEAVVPFFGDRNNFRLPYFFRLDVGVVLKFFPKWGESDLTLNIFNATDRRNAFFIYLEPVFNEATTPEGDIIRVPERIAARQVSLFPILPALSWNFKF